MNTLTKIALVIIVIAIGIVVVGSLTNSGNNENIKNVTTPYGTTCHLNIGKGMYSEETVVNDDGQKLVFDDGANKGIFISTTQDLSDLIAGIEATGTKCSDDGVTWYHMKDQQLANTYSVFGGTHLKLEDVNEYNVGFMKNPNNDEVIVLVAGPDTIVDCFNSIQWG